MSMLGCASGKKKISPIEVWKIDHHKSVLFREIKGNKEQVIPIRLNKDMEKFMCIDKREYQRLRHELIEGR